jgi:hypothetical protein
LGNEKALEAIAGHEGERDSKKSSLPSAGNSSSMNKQPMPTSFGLEVLGETAADLVEDQPHQAAWCD